MNQKVKYMFQFTVKFSIYFIFLQSFTIVIHDVNKIEMYIF